MRKIQSCFRDLADDPDVGIEQIKSKLLPLMKGNQLLINWFVECLGGATITEHTPNEYETVTVRKATDAVDDESEAYEHIPQSEIQSDPFDNPCNIRYINGGIYYGSRILLPAKLSFTVSGGGEAGADESIAADRKRTHDIHLEDGVVSETVGARTTLHGSPNKYRCVHEIKHFGDAKIREQNKYPIDADLGSGTHEDGDDSDDESLHTIKADVNEERLAEAIAAADLPPSVHSKNLCDDILLKAHGIRLNPSVHSSMVLSNSDMLNMLKPSYRTIEK